MDDILVFSTSLTEHFESLQKIFNKLNEYNLKIQIDKFTFLSKETNFLGHIITNRGIRPNPDKIAIIQKLQLPRTVKEIKSFLGLTGYYRKFIKNYSMIASPIIKYLRKDSRINLNDVLYIEAFERLKKILINPPLLCYPDFNRKFVLTADASNLAIGAVLSQGGKPISYASRTLNGHEKNYSTLEKELLAIVWSVKYYRPYLYGRKFLIQSDHQPLKWLYSLKDPNSRIIRWKILLDEFYFDIEYLKGKENQVADFLSRVQLNHSSLKLEHSAEENLNPKFFLAEKIVNMYKKQIRIVKNKNRETEILFNKYKIIYISENDLTNAHYLNDLLRRELREGKVGIYSEIDENGYNIVKNK